MIFLLLACTGAPDSDTGATPCVPGPGIICRYAGTGSQALGKDGVPATESALYLPQDITFGPDSNGYFEDWSNHRLRRVDPEGMVTTIAGVVFIGDGPEGPAITAGLNHPTHIVFGPDNNLYFAAWHNSRVDKIDMSTMMLSFLAGNGSRSYGGDGGPALDASLNLPCGVAFDSTGRLYISDQANWRIRRMDLETGILDTYAGTGVAGFAGDGGPASEAQFYSADEQEATPSSRIIIQDDVLFLADTLNHRIRRIDLTTDQVSTYAGNGKVGTGGDGGPATKAELFGPTDIALGVDGELYIADTENSCVRVVHPDGILDTFAGKCGVPGSDGDGGPALEAGLNRPYGVSVGPDGNVYIGDTYNNVIRVVYRN